MSEQVSIVAVGEPPGRPRDALGTTTELYELDQLAEQVGRFAGITVPVRRAPLAEVSDTGFLLYGRSPDWFDGGPEKAARTVLFCLPRFSGKASRLLHEGGFVAGIDSIQFMQWNRDTRGEAQMYGLESVARAIGGHVIDGVKTGEYCFFASAQGGETLPSLLARYLAAHDRLRKIRP